MKRTWADGDRTLVFAPDPPVDTYRYGAVGSSWNSAGADNSNNIAMAVSGTIQQREPIDVCGLAVDTYQVSTTESLVDLATGEQIGTNTGAANVTNIATQLGGLLVRQQVHVTDSRRDSTGKDVSVEFDYTSTLTSLDPGAGG